MRSRVGNAKNGIGALDVVGDAEARLGFPVRGQSVVEIAAQSQVEAQFPLVIESCSVKSKFLHVGVAVEGVQAASAGLGQIVGKQEWCSGADRGPDALR